MINSLFLVLLYSEKTTTTNLPEIIRIHDVAELYSERQHGVIESFLLRSNYF